MWREGQGKLVWASHATVVTSLSSAVTAMLLFSRDLEGDTWRWRRRDDPNAGGCERGIRRFEGSFEVRRGIAHQKKFDPRILHASRMADAPAGTRHAVAGITRRKQSIERTQLRLLQATER